jgi:hypothetical protein
MMVSAVKSLQTMQQHDSTHSGGESLEGLGEDLGAVETIVGICTAAQLLDFGCWYRILEHHHVGDCC